MQGEYKELAEKIEKNSGEKLQLDEEMASLKYNLNKIKGISKSYDDN